MAAPHNPDWRSLLTWQQQQAMAARGFSRYNWHCPNKCEVVGALQLTAETLTLLQAQQTSPHVHSWIILAGLTDQQEYVQQLRHGIGLQEVFERRLIACHNRTFKLLTCRVLQDSAAEALLLTDIEDILLQQNARRVA